MKLKNLLGRPKKANTQKDTTCLKVDNHFKSLQELTMRTPAEKKACGIFATFYENSDEQNGNVKPDSLPLTLYANCLRTLRLRLEAEHQPLSLVPIIWNELSIAKSKKNYTNNRYKTYRYSPNYDYERALIFAGLMSVISQSYPRTEIKEHLVNCIRQTAGEMWKDCFNIFENKSSIFNEDEVSISLGSALRYLNMQTLDDSEKLAIQKFLNWSFANNTLALERINEIHIDNVKASNQFHIETLNMHGGDINEIHDNKMFSDVIKGIAHEHKKLE